MTRKRKNKYNSMPTFDFMDYSLNFDFYNMREKKTLYQVLKEAWEWAYPNVKDENEESKENSN